MITKFIKDELASEKNSATLLSNLILINFAGKDAKDVEDIADSIADHIKYILNSQGYKTFDNIVLGPNPCIINKIKDSYRYQLLLKDVDVPFRLLKKAIKYLLIDNRGRYIPRNISCNIDINPCTIV